MVSDGISGCSEVHPLLEFELLRETLGGLSPDL
jgi:hypothetical protein